MIPSKDPIENSIPIEPTPNIPTYTIGQLVTLRTPDNPRLNRQFATINVVTQWGAYVFCDAAATGQYRALHEEIITDLPPINQDNVVFTTTSKIWKPTPSTGEVRSNPIASGYTGNFCVHCQSSRMVRCGICERCEDCGETSGCS